MLAACTMKGGDSFLSSFFRYYSPLARRNNGILLEVFQFPLEKLPVEKTSHFPWKTEKGYILHHHLHYSALKTPACSPSFAPKIFKT